MHRKLDADLRRRIEASDPHEILTVVIELAADDPSQGADDEAGASRGQRVARRKAAFDARADELESALARLGAHGLERAWLNQTIKAAVPAGAMDAVADLGSVAAVGMPRRIVAEDA